MTADSSYDYENSLNSYLCSKLFMLDKWWWQSARDRRFHARGQRIRTGRVSDDSFEAGITMTRSKRTWTNSWDSASGFSAGDHSNYLVSFACRLFSTLRKRFSVLIVSYFVIILPIYLPHYLSRQGVRSCVCRSISELLLNHFALFILTAPLLLQRPPRRSWITN